jgi:hypothetical protein
MALTASRYTSLVGAVTTASNAGGLAVFIHGVYTACIPATLFRRVIELSW